MDEQRKHIIDCMNSGIRLDGRKDEEYREVSVETNVTNTAEGSARVKIGETEVIAGVKLSLEQPYPDSPDSGTISVNVELLPLSSPEFESGPPSIQAIELARVVDRGIRESKAIDFKSLMVVRGEKVWVLLIDICPLNDAGNLFDACALAALAAVRSTRFPTLSYTDDKGKEKVWSVDDYKKAAKGEQVVPNGTHFSIDYKKPSDKKVEMVHEPISVTVLKIGDHFIVDPVSKEEKVLDARLTTASLKDGTLCAMQKGGENALSKDDIDKMMTIAMKKAAELRKKVEA